MRKARFTEEEDAILLLHHGEGMDACLERLPGRSRESVKHRAARIGVGFRKFKEDRPATDAHTIKALNKFIGLRV